ARRRPPPASRRAGCATCSGTARGPPRCSCCSGRSRASAPPSAAPRCSPRAGGPGTSSASPVACPPRRPGRGRAATAAASSAAGARSPWCRTRSARPTSGWCGRPSAATGCCPRCGGCPRRTGGSRRTGCPSGPGRVSWTPGRGPPCTAARAPGLSGRPGPASIEHTFDAAFPAVGTLGEACVGCTCCRRASGRPGRPARARPRAVAAHGGPVGGGAGRAGAGGGRAGARGGRTARPAAARGWAAPRFHGRAPARARRHVAAVRADRGGFRRGSVGGRGRQAGARAGGGGRGGRAAGAARARPRAGARPGGRRRRAARRDGRRGGGGRGAGPGGRAAAPGRPRAPARRGAGGARVVAGGRPRARLHRRRVARPGHRGGPAAGAAGRGAGARPGHGGGRAVGRRAAAGARRRRGPGPAGPGGGAASRGRAGGGMSRPATPTRVLALRSPDWPVPAAAMAARVPTHRPAAVVVANRVLACSAVARAHGVRRGLRRREAQARCPDLAVLAPDPDRDARAFEPVVAAVEELAPGVEVVRPGLVALPARGPVSWFGGELEAAEALVDQVAARTSVEWHGRVADGLFAAVLAARRALIVAPGDTPAFLAPLGVEELDREPDVDRSELVGLLRRLGLRSLGAFAALDPEDVASRFGADAVLCHRLARGLDPRPPVRRTPPEELAVEVELDPPVDRVDAAAFAARGLAERLHRTLA